MGEMLINHQAVQAMNVAASSSAIKINSLSKDFEADSNTISGGAAGQAENARKAAATLIVSTLGVHAEDLKTWATSLGQANNAFAQTDSAQAASIGGINNVS